MAGHKTRAKGAAGKQQQNLHWDGSSGQAKCQMRITQATHDQPTGVKDRTGRL